MELLESYLSLDLNVQRSDDAPTDAGTSAAPQGAGQPGEEVLRALSFIMHGDTKLLESALDILDDGDRVITCFKCANYSRYVWMVNSRRSSYICLQLYCPCKSYFEKARVAANSSGAKGIMCKHLLAIRIGHKLRTIRTEVTGHGRFVDMMSGTLDRSNER